MCLPVITFLSLIFIALSQGVEFSSKAAVWNPIGSIADLFYIGLFAVGISLPAYYGKNRLIKNYDYDMKIIEILSGLFIGFSGYFSLVLLFSRIPVNSGLISLAFLWAVSFILYMLFKRLQEKKIEAVKPVSKKEVVFRGLFGGSVVAAVVMLGDSAGYVWGGLFSSFPGTITPVLVLLHMKNGKDMSYSVIKSAPVGLSATGLYSCMVWLTYPTYGIIAGTLASYFAVIVFLFAMEKL